MKRGTVLQNNMRKKAWHILLAGVLVVVLFLCGCGKKNTEEKAETAAGKWKLVSMVYDGVSLDEEELEEMGSLVTLELAQDGTGIMNFEGLIYELTWDENNITMDGVPDAYTLSGDRLKLAQEGTEMIFTRTSGSTGDSGDQDAQEDDPFREDADDPQEASGDGSNGAEQTFHITPVASGLELETYSNSDFSIDIPQGWVVEAAPTSTGMTHVFRAYDPSCPVNQILFGIKFEPLFESEEGRTYTSMNAGAVYGASYQELYASCPVLTNVSTEGFFQVFSEYANVMEMDSATVGVTLHLPRIQDFSVLESFASGSGMSSVAVSSDLLHATFTQDGMEGEGMFSADIIPHTLQGGLGYYTAYDIVVMTAQKDMFQNWEDILTRSLKSLDYTESFVDFAMSQSNQQVQTSRKLSQAASEMSDSIMSSWENRNKSEDIMRQKQSDATLGLERVMDTQTGEIYQTDNGFTDWYDGERYKAITDEQYTEPVKGTFPWK